MKKSILILSLFLAKIVIAQTLINVGGAPLCGSSVNSNVPANYDGWSGKNSWSAFMYKASDINYSTGGLITEISFIADCKSSSCSFDIAENQKLYMKLVSNQNFTNSTIPNITSMTKVFDGSITWKRGSGSPYEWTSIALDNTFEYDGFSNILFYFENENNTPLGGFFGCGSSPGYLVNNLGNNTSLYSVYGTTKPSSGTLGNQIPLMQITFSGALTVSEQNSIKNDIISFTKSKILTIKYSGAIIGVIQVSLYDVYGKYISSFKSSNNILVENLSFLRSGVYVVKIEIDNKMIVKKIII